MSSSVHIDNKKRRFHFWERSKKGLGEHSLTAEKMYSIIFSATERRFCVSLHYNGANRYLFVNGVETIKFKVSGVIPKVLCFRNVSKDFSARNMKKKKKEKQDNMELFMILVLIMVLF